VGHDNDTYVNTLIEDGVVVIPLFDEEEVRSYVNRLEAVLKVAPDSPAWFRREGYEGISFEERKVLVGGSFSALGSVSAYYNDVVRDLLDDLIARLHAFQRALAIRLRQPFIRHHSDRLLIRPGDAKVQSEAWHRDISINDSTPYQFGGWLALRGRQRFSHIRGNYLSPANYAKHLDGLKRHGKNHGFAKEKPPQNVPKRVADIPPGSVIIFYTHVFHEIAPTPKGTPLMIRQFYGFSLSNNPNTVDRNYVKTQQKRWRDQVPQLIPSGQEPLQVPRNYWPLQRERLRDISREFPDFVVMDWQVKPDPRREHKAWHDETFRGLKPIAEKFPEEFKDTYGPTTISEISRLEYQRIY